ncbi:hypothetical protein CHS0354_008372 [Potamilus streckersoni]|uniref:non-specific serine/threonine protein kinase n=1 Tax=Potamilus streckersoni TaxID=2493646 RepID=A0AAE0RPK7_9BIVA|nr:hypothetical protein CHS0354_008372 [Potamilus streckersoni]
MATATANNYACSLLQVGTLELEEEADSDTWYKGLAVLSPDKVMVVDFSKSNLSLHIIPYGELLAVSDRLKYPQDICICNVHDNEIQIAVSLFNAKIEILSIKSTGQTSAITRGRTLDVTTGFDKCRGVKYLNEKLLISGQKRNSICWGIVSFKDGHVDVVHKICEWAGYSSSYLSINPRDDSMVYISCQADQYNTGIHVFRNSEREFLYQHDELKFPRGVTVDTQGFVFVCNEKPALIHQLTEKGQLMTIYREEIPSNLLAIFWENKQGHLYVTSSRSKVITIFRPTYSRQQDPDIPLEILRMDEASLQIYKEALLDGKEKTYDIRVMVVGHYGVGKTALTKRLLGEEVDIFERKSTEGIDVHVDCCRISLDTWEWSAQNKEADKYSRLQRLVTFLKHKSTLDISPEGHSEIIYQRETTPVINVRTNIEESVTDNEDVSTSSEPYTKQETKHRSGDNVLRQGIKRKYSSESVERDSMIELLQLVNENAAKLEKIRLEAALLTVWDFAGQYVFYTTHQTFLTSRAIYLLVTDLSQHLSDIVIDNECFFDIDGIKLCKVHEFVEVWLNSIHSIAPFPAVDIPPVILVGTHLDKIPQGSRQSVVDRSFQQIRSILKDQPSRFHLTNDDFAIDNTKRDPRLEDLKRKIIDLARKQPHWGQEVPTRWLLLEQAIMTLKASGTKVVDLSVVRELNQRGSVPIETEKELDLFLRFQHEKGIIIYFSAKRLNKKIVLDPEWLIDALKSLITAKAFIYKNNPAIIEKWEEFEKNGKLSPDLIDAVWTKETNVDFYENKEHILQLMTQLNIIVMPRSFNDSGDEVKMETFYIAPCMLRQATPKEVICPELSPHMGSTSVLCCMFTEKFLPSPIFHRLLAACMVRWPVAKKESEHLIFCGCSVFDLDRSHRLILHLKNHCIFVRIIRIGIRLTTPISKLCIEVREHIDKTLSHIIGYLASNLHFQWFLQCPRSEIECLESMIPALEIKENAELMCKFHGNHAIESYELCKFWYENEEVRAAIDPENPIPCYPLELEDKRPSDQQLSRLSLRIGREFHTLGLELGISGAEIQQIQIENPFVTTQCLMILLKWAHRNLSQATFRNLSMALWKVGADSEILKNLDEADNSMSCLSPQALDIRPTEQELKKISEHVGKELLHLAVELGIPLSRIEQIRLEHRQSVARQSLEILFAWRKRNAGQATFRTLERVFRRLHMDVNILNQVLPT